LHRDHPAVPNTLGLHALSGKIFKSTAIFHFLVARQSSWSDASQFSSILGKVNRKQINSFFFSFIRGWAGQKAEKKNISKSLIKLFARIWKFYFWLMKKWEAFKGAIRAQQIAWSLPLKSLKPL
jgi:hypothetical protein